MLSESRYVKMGKFEIRHHGSSIPFEPMYEGHKPSLYDRFGMFYCVWRGKRRDYDIHLMTHNNNVPIHQWFNFNPLAWGTVNIKKLRRATWERGVIVGGLWITVYVEIHTKRST